MRTDLNADAIRPVGGAGAWLIHSRSLGVSALLGLLRARPDLVYAEPDFENRSMQSGAAPNDPGYPQQWALSNTGQTILGVTGTPGDDIDALGAWPVSTGSQFVVVDVVDTGVDGSNSDMLPNLWSAPAAFTLTIGGNQYNCPAGTRGFSAVTGDSYCDSADVDVAGHGTWVASMIGAAGNNGVGLTGVNWSTSILNLRAASRDADGFDGDFYADDAASAIEAGIQIKAQFGSGANLRVINLSYGATPTGSGFSQTMENEIERAGSVGILVVAAAGNESTNGVDYPAAYELLNELAVGGSSQNDTAIAVTNYGSGVQISAPGQNIYGWALNGNYEIGSGTSASTAYVSGAAVLVANHCSLDAVGLRATLMGTANTIPALSGWNATSGRLNVARAITSCSGAPASTTITVTGDGCPTCRPGPHLIMDTGAATVTVDGITSTARWSSRSSTSISIANALAAAISGPYYTAQASVGSSSATVTVTSEAKGPYTNDYAFKTNMTDSCNPQPDQECFGNPFDITPNSGNFSGGHN